MRRTGFVLPLVLAALGACSSVQTRQGVDISAGNATLQAEMRVQVDEMRYLHGDVLYQRMSRLAALGEESAPAVREGVRSDDWLVRSSCLWILGATGDRRNIPAIHAALADPVAVVRYQAASSLVKLGDGRGFRTLVEGLADGDLQNRYKCFQSLRSATGKDFGYLHDAAPDERRTAVGRWLDWLEQVEPSAL